MEVAGFIVMIAGCYLLGSLNVAYLAGRRLGKVDLRRVGSGNLGTGNVYRHVGKGVAAAVFFIDCAKEALPLLLIRLAGGSGVWQVGAGLAVIAGHNWPVFLRFRGGRGMAMTLTGTLILLPWEGLVMVALLALGVFTRHTAEMNLLALFLVPVISWRLGRSPEMVCFALFTLVMAVARRLQGSKAIAEKGGRRELRKVLWTRFVYDRELVNR